MEDSAPLILTKPIRCRVKLGGAAITFKNELEKVNEENLEIVSSQLRQAMISGSDSQKILGMDWSKRPGKPEISCDMNNFESQTLLDSSSFIVVHGAGSFGHFQASKSGVHRGGLNQPLVRAGFVATRISVTTLNLEIVRVLARGTDLVMKSLFAVETRVFLPLECLHFHVDGQLQKEMSETLKKSIASADLSMVAKAIDSGFVSVLHGDAVLDESQGCTILSGDVIIHHLAAYLRPELNVHNQFQTLTAVNEDGSWSVVKPALQNSVEITVAAHDTTGGMVTKISEAAMIAKLGIDVYIVMAATSHSLKALSGEVRGTIPDDWIGTVIRFADKGTDRT